jgi:hypothetical protein
MKSVLTTAVLALSLAAASAFAQDISKATTQADCEKSAVNGTLTPTGVAKGQLRWEKRKARIKVQMSARPPTMTRRKSNNPNAVIGERAINDACFAPFRVVQPPRQNPTPSN